MMDAYKTLFVFTRPQNSFTGDFVKAEPDTVIAHNADAIEGAELVWRFNSISFLDRDLDLEATSILSPANK